MRIFGLEITRPRRKGMSAVDTGGQGWFGVIRESFGGAYQRNITVDAPKNVVAFGAVFSCVTIIASDIAKLCLDLVVEDANGICSDAPSGSPFWAVLRKPNRYQNRIKFVEQWIVSKLLHGNAYIYKERKDLRGLVTALYVLDPQRVTPLVTDSGEVYYQIAADHLSGIQGSITVPASEIIHDMMVSLWHPLVGVSPIYACGMSATMGNRIQANSTHFFQNMSLPSGQLTSPTTIDDVTANRLKATFEENFSRGNIGRLLVSGDGLKYEAMPTIPAVDAQLVAQLDWTIADVARCYHVPLYKLGAETGQQAGTRLSVEALNQAYYDECLQILIESLELCLKEGLELAAGLDIEVDLEGLLRMDTANRYDSLGKLVGAGIMSPNEARAKEDLKPVAGGDSPLLQEQYYSLAALAKRDASSDPWASKKPAAPPALLAPPAANDEAAAAQQAAEFLDYVAKGLACETT